MSIRITDDCRVNLDNNSIVDAVRRKDKETIEVRYSTGKHVFFNSDKEPEEYQRFLNYIETGELK